MKILVTGGAGYIGSHIVRRLRDANHEVVIFDDLSAGYKEAIKGFNLIIGSLTDRAMLDKVFRENNFDSVIHLAGSIEAGESMINPKQFFENNLLCGLNLLEAMLTHNVKKIVFSSSASVYGEPEKMPIKETAPRNPSNSYGLSKLIFEQILDKYDDAYGLKSVSLRFFNAAGADPSGEIGEFHNPETHLIPLVMQTALGKKDSIKIYGTDYPTPDGTGIRDYVHVYDLADAHILAFEYLEKNNASEVFNLGNEKGFSVREIIDTAKKITGIDFPIIEAERRAGDPAKLCASSKKARKILGWNPKFDSIEQILQTAWNWHKNHPEGFRN